MGSDMNARATITTTTASNGKLSMRWGVIKNRNSSGSYNYYYYY